MAIATVSIQRKLFTAEEFEQLVRAGVVGEDERLELIEGEIVETSPVGALHIQVVNRLNRLLVLHLAERAVVSVQYPIRLANSEPQPDLAILRAEVEAAPTVVPTAKDVLLLIEVADTTAAYDRNVKVPLYARGGISETWLLDLGEAVIEVYREPGPAGYRSKQTFGSAEQFAPGAFPELRLTVQDILPA